MLLSGLERPPDEHGNELPGGSTHPARERAQEREQDPFVLRLTQRERR
jgi:hypothetical protein